MRAAIADAGSTLQGLSWPVLVVLILIAATVAATVAMWRRDHARHSIHQCRIHVTTDGFIVCLACGRDMTGDLEALPAGLRDRMRERAALAHLQHTCRHTYRPVQATSGGVLWRCDDCGLERNAVSLP